MVSDNYVIVGVIALIVIGGLAAFFLINSPKQISATGQAASESSQQLPVRELGNFVKYSNEPLLDNDKVKVVFVGAEFCPFCAVERWPIVEALSRFGTFSGLKETTSASFNEPFLDLPTYNFMGAGYSSNYVQLNHKETADRNFKPLEQLTPEEERLFNTYNPRGSIPFLLVGGKKGIIVQVGAGYSPGSLSSLTFSQIENDLKNNPDSRVVQSIQNEAKIITALICYNNDNKPADVCNDPEIASLVSQLR